LHFFPPVYQPARRAIISSRSAFDNARWVQEFARRRLHHSCDTPAGTQIAILYNGDNGRIGVAAVDLATGREVRNSQGDQRFPVASIIKVPLQQLRGRRQGRRWSLDDRYPLLHRRSAIFEPRLLWQKRGQYSTARELIRSHDHPQRQFRDDAIIPLRAGTDKVNDWLRRLAGIKGSHRPRYCHFGAQ
jgi:beta-lactamase class A